MNCYLIVGLALAMALEDRISGDRVISKVSVLFSLRRDPKAVIEETVIGMLWVSGTRLLLNDLVLIN